MMGVGINNIEQVVQLTSFTNMNIECLPTPSENIYTGSRRLSQIQVAEKLLKDCEN